MNHDPFAWGRPSDETYGSYNNAIANAGNVSAFPKMNTQQPIITGTSVIAIKCKDGIVMAADNLGSYGSLARFDDIERLVEVGVNTVVGMSGDISDLQQVKRMLEQLEIDQSYEEETSALRAEHIHEYLSRVFYNRRSKMNPLWNACVVAGLSDDKPVLKYVDLLGVTYESACIATGFGGHLAIPLLRQKCDFEAEYADISLDEAEKVIKECMKVLYYRDARALDKYSLCRIDNNAEKKVTITKDVRCEDMKWEFAQHIKGYGTQVV